MWPLFWLPLTLHITYVYTSDFQIFESMEPWTNASQTCQKNSSVLAVLNDFKAILEARLSLASLGYESKNDGEFWIGLVHNASSRQYYWTSGVFPEEAFLQRRLCDHVTDEVTFNTDWCYVLQREKTTGSFELQHKDCATTTDQYGFICQYMDQSLDYQIHLQEKTWKDARRFCLNNGSFLAVFNTQEEIVAVERKIGLLGNSVDRVFWVGLVYNSTATPAFHWSSGEVAYYDHLNEFYGIEPKDWCHVLTLATVACFSKKPCRQGGNFAGFTNPFICQPSERGSAITTTANRRINTASLNSLDQQTQSITTTAKNLQHFVTSSSLSEDKLISLTSLQVRASTLQTTAMTASPLLRSYSTPTNVASRFLATETQVTSNSVHHSNSFSSLSTQEIAFGLQDSLVFQHRQEDFSSTSSDVIASSSLSPVVRSVDIARFDRGPTPSIRPVDIARFDVRSNKLSHFKDAMASLNPRDPQSLGRAAMAYQELISSLNPRKVIQDGVYDIIDTARIMEEFALKYASFNLNLTNREEKTENYYIALQVSMVPRGQPTDFTFVEDDGKNNFVKITLPSLLFENQDTVVVTALYKNLHKYVKDSTTKRKRLNSRILGTAISPVNQQPFPKNITLTFSTLEIIDKEVHRSCVFWNYSITITGSWSDVGCSLVEANSSHVVCTCNHLTNFAVLMDVKKHKLSERNRHALQLITYVGLSVSLLGETITIVSYFLLLCSRYDQQSHVHANLVGALAMAQLVFLAGIDATHKQVLCVSVAAFIHYFYLVSFCWMLIEGIMLYQLIVEVYDPQLNMILCYCFSLGFPGIVVGGSLAIANFVAGGIHQYIDSSWCWLSTENYFIWSFVGPVLLIVVINIVFFTCVAKEIVSMPRAELPRMNSIRTTLKACIVLFPLLGVTWLSGLLSVTRAGVVSQYIFTVLNSLQGLLIFLLHCVRNSEIQAMWNKRIMRLKKRASYFFKSGSPPPTASTHHNSCKQEATEDCNRRQNKIAPTEN